MRLSENEIREIAARYDSDISDEEVEFMQDMLDGKGSGLFEEELEDDIDLDTDDDFEHEFRG